MGILHMSKITELILSYFCYGAQLITAIRQELSNIRTLTFECEVAQMPKRIFQAIEAMFRALIYFEILLMGASIGGLSLFVVVGLAIRFGQLVYELILKEKWL
jgi:hypothetical protein